MYIYIYIYMCVLYVYIYIHICIIYNIPCIIFETFPYTQMLNNLGMFFLASIFEVGWCFPLFSKRIWNAPHLDIPWNGLLVASFHHKVFLGEPTKTLPYHKFWICWLCKNGESFWPSKNVQKTMAIRSKWPWKTKGQTLVELPPVCVEPLVTISSVSCRASPVTWRNCLGEYVYTSYMIMIALFRVFVYKF